MSPKSVRMTLIAVAAAIALAAGAWLGWRSAQGPDRPNVILISIDTLLADHLSCYGYPGEITPHIDLLAGEGVRFTNVTTAAPLTRPAHATMLTSLIPPVHGVRANEDRRLAEGNVTLAELLTDEGYLTGAVVGSSVLDAESGLAQGFDTYDAPRLERRGENVSQLAGQWLDRRAADGPFFLFVHYNDPHADYDPPADFAARWPDDPYAGEVAY
ncbi:MAG: sulfatase-like hydrolase/transferase, partial [Planctomycetota bacterium]